MKFLVIFMGDIFLIADFLVFIMLSIFIIDIIDRSIKAMLVLDVYFLNSLAFFNIIKRD